MARLVGPDESSRLSYTLHTDNRLGLASGLPVVVFADPGGSVLADILTVDGVPVAAGQRWAGEVTYIIGRLPDGAGNYFPVS